MDQQGEDETGRWRTLPPRTPLEELATGHEVPPEPQARQPRRHRIHADFRINENVESPGADCFNPSFQAARAFGKCGGMAARDGRNQLRVEH